MKNFIIINRENWTSQIHLLGANRQRITNLSKNSSWEHQKNAFDKFVMDCRLQNLVKNGKTIVGTALKIKIFIGTQKNRLNFYRTFKNFLIPICSAVLIERAGKILICLGAISIDFRMAKNPSRPQF